MNINPGQAMNNPFLTGAHKVGERKSGGGIVGRLMDIQVHGQTRAIDVQAGMALQEHAHGLTLQRMGAEHQYKLAEIKATHKQGRKNVLTQAGADVARMKETGHQERLTHSHVLRTNQKYGEGAVAPHDSGTVPAPEAHVGPEPVRVPAPPRLSVPVMAAAAKVQPPQAQKVPSGNKPKMGAASLNPATPRPTPAPSAAAKQIPPKAPTVSGQLGIPGVARPQARMSAPAKPPKR